MKYLYKFHVDFGRMGVLSGIFFADPRDIDKVIGKMIYPSDVLGKHSNFNIELSFDNISIITDDRDLLKELYKTDIATGFNPLDWIEE